MTVDEEYSQAYLQEYQELVAREYERIEKLKLFKDCVHCGKKVYKYGANICSNCFRNKQRWGSDYGKPINLNHLIALAEMLDYKPNEKLVALVEKLRFETCNNELINFNSGKYPLNTTAITKSLIVAFYFMFERSIIESGVQFKSYVIYLMIFKTYLRDSLKRRMKLFDRFEEEGLLALLIDEHYNFMEYLDGRSLKRHYEKGNYTPYEI